MSYMYTHTALCSIMLFFYCRNDYFDMFAPKCGGCGLPIIEDFISTLNTQWHTQCFRCKVSNMSSWTRDRGTVTSLFISSWPNIACQLLRNKTQQLVLWLFTCIVLLYTIFVNRMVQLSYWCRNNVSSCINWQYLSLSSIVLHGHDAISLSP